MDSILSVTSSWPHTQLVEYFVCSSYTLTACDAFIAFYKEIEYDLVSLNLKGYSISVNMSVCEQVILCYYQWLYISYLVNDGH